VDGIDLESERLWKSALWRFQECNLDFAEQTTSYWIGIDQLCLDGCPEGIGDVEVNVIG
jgi:hypothetical protein